MKKSRNAFTMMELIFVIVILGILAAVAIPKLAATRKDADNVKIAQNIMTGASEIASYAMSQAATESNLSKMSNAIAWMEESGEASIDTNNKRAIIACGSVSDCVTIEIKSGIRDENLTLAFGNSGNDGPCSGLQAVIDERKYPMKLRGSGVKY